MQGGGAREETASLKLAYDVDLDVCEAWDRYMNEHGDE